MSQVFISYSRKDLAFVTRLARDLQDAGLTVWYDVSGLDVGIRWEREIENAIRQSQYFIIILSPSSVDSEWIEREFMYACERKLRILPIVFKQCNIRMLYINLHQINMRGKNYQKNFAALLKALGVRKISEKEPNEEHLWKKLRKIFSLRLTFHEWLPLLAAFGLIVALIITCFLCLKIGGTPIIPTPIISSTPTPTATFLETPFQLAMTTPQCDPSSIVDTNSKIAFVSDFGNLYLMSEDGTNQVLIATIGDGKYLSWSPDGKKLAYVTGGNNSSGNNIYVLYIEGTDQVRLTDNKFYDSYPAWSPDGSEIAFVSNRDGNHEIYTMNIYGTNLVRLTNNPAQDTMPAWSPDGSQIVFVSFRDGNGEIYVMNANGKDQTRLTNNNVLDETPAWSPDGLRIAYVSNQDRYPDIFVMNPYGTAQLHMTYNDASDLSPAWSPDGSKVLFTSDRDGNNEIYMMNRDATDQCRLTNNATNDRYPSWLFNR
jgi:hypothetical protein